MSKNDPVERVRRALTSVLATATLLLLALGFVLPLTTIEALPDSRIHESVATLWQEGIDHGFTDGGGAGTLVWAVALLVVTLAALVAAWSAALMFGGGIGPRGALVARCSALVLLLGATWMGFQAHRLTELAVEWNERDAETVVAGAGAWWLLAGAVVFAAATLPPSAQWLWRSAPVAQQA